MSFAGVSSVKNVWAAAALIRSAIVKTRITPAMAVAYVFGNTLTDQEISERADRLLKWEYWEQVPGINMATLNEDLAEGLALMAEGIDIWKEIR